MSHSDELKLAPDFAAFDEQKIATMESITAVPADGLLKLSGLTDKVKTEPVYLLESAAGAGCLTAALLRAVPVDETKDLKIVCGDVVPEMVKLAAARSIKEGWKGVETKVFDGMDIPYPDATFTHAMIHYGIQLYPDPSKGISENHRVLQPGGTFAVSVWHTPGFLPYLLRANPAFTAPGPMRHPLTKPETAGPTLEEAGFTNVRTEDVVVAVDFESPRYAVQQWYSLMKGMFKDEDMVKRVEELLREDHGDGAFKLDWKGLNVAADKA